jgi:hypothetical protein
MHKPLLFCNDSHFIKKLKEFLLDLFGNGSKSHYYHSTFTIFTIDSRLINWILNLNFDTWFFNSEIFDR